MVRPNIDKIRITSNKADVLPLRQLGIEYALDVPMLLDYIDELEVRLGGNK